MKYKFALIGNSNTDKDHIFQSVVKRKTRLNANDKSFLCLQGEYAYSNNDYVLINTPSIYSLNGTSEPDHKTRDLIYYNQYDGIIVVSNALSLETNLSLVFQAQEYYKNVILVINFSNKTESKIKINRLGLMHELGIPVVFRNKNNIDQFKETLDSVVQGNFPYKPLKIKYPKLEDKQNKIKDKLNFIDNIDFLSQRILDSGNDFFDEYYIKNPDYKINIEFLREGIKAKEHKEYIYLLNHKLAKSILSKHVIYEDNNLNKTNKIDSLLTSKYGFLVTFLMLFIIFFITIQLSRYPSSLLFTFFSYIETQLLNLANILKVQDNISSFLIYGIYQAIAYLIAILLPPMLIFFPLFTLLENIGYLPRIVYNLDHHFKKCGCSGNQSVSTCIGFGCNITGVIESRNIPSTKEKHIALLTNTFIPCVGRLPIILTMISVFFVAITSTTTSSLLFSLIASLFIFFGMIVSLFVTKLLSVFMLKGNRTAFSLELPPYKSPNFKKILYISIIERLLFVLKKTTIFAIISGIIIWMFANIYINDQNLFYHLSTTLNPLGIFLGMDGIIIIAFIMAIPIKEMLLPLIIMLYTSSTSLTIVSLSSINTMLIDNNWTILTVINVLLFSLLALPCGAMLYSIYKETNSKKLTFYSFIIPTTIGISVCIITNIIYNIL